MKHIKKSFLLFPIVWLALFYSSCSAPSGSSSGPSKNEQAPQVPIGMPRGTTMTWVDGGWYPKGPSIEFQEEELMKVELVEAGVYGGLGRFYHVRKLGSSDESITGSSAYLPDKFAEVDKLNSSVVGAPYYVFVGTEF